MTQIILYTMGKVGSKAMSLSLERQGVCAFHIHTLDPAEIKRRMSAALAKNELPEGHICTSAFLLQRNLDRPVYVTKLRDPMARNLSAFFQNLTAYGIDDPSTLSPQDFFDIFEQRYHHHIPLTWFDREWRKFLGFEMDAVHACPGNVFEAKGDKGRFVIFHADATDEQVSRKLSELAGKSVNILRRNIGVKKVNGSLYADMVNQGRPSRELVHRLYSSKMVQTFWTTEQIAAMRSHWLDDGRIRCNPAGLAVHAE